MSRYTKSRKKFTGCDEDCFNYPYRDCLKPTYKLNRDDSIARAVNYVPKPSGNHIYSSVIKINE